MESRFEEFKKIILGRAKEASACTEQYRRAYSSESFKELTTVIRDNFFWCVDNDVITGELIDEYKKEFADGGIWHNENVTEGYMIATGSATVDASGSATVRAYDNVTVEASGSAYVNTISSIECKLSDCAIARVNNNKICYASDNLKFEKIEEQK